MKNKYLKNVVFFLVIIFLFSLVVYLLPSDPSASDKPSPDKKPPVDNSPISVTVDFSKMSYVAFGDSITFGVDAYRGVQMEYPYSRLVADKLSLHSYSNMGVNGATFCTNTLNRVCMTERVLSYTDKADIISVMLGVNDFATSLPLGKFGDRTTATIYGSLYLMAEHLTTTQEDAFIFFMTPYKCKLEDKTYEDKNQAGYTLADVANAIKTVANKYDIPVLDMFNEGKFELEMYNAISDGLHPSPEFIAEYTAPQIEAFIRQYLKNK